MPDTTTITETETVVVTEKRVEVVSIGIQGPPGPGLATTDDLPEGDDNQYYTDERVSANAAVAANTAARHTHANKAVLDATTASFTTADESKLDGVAAGATANATDSQLRDRSTHTGTQPIGSVSGLSASLAAKEDTANKGAAGGYASLDGAGKVPAAQLPSYVDDVLSYADLAAFPGTGETSKIYVAEDTNITYRWSGSAYVEISQSLALGETSATAYRGDRGKTAYDHSQVTIGNPHNVTAADVGKDTAQWNADRLLVSRDSIGITWRCCPAAS